MSSYNWSQNEVLQLIEEYRTHPLLWDCKMKDYKDRNKRHDALVEIASSLNIDKSEIERKIKNLQSHFSKECKRLSEEKNTKMKSGSGASAYEGKWFAFKSMEFLIDRNKPKKTINTELIFSSENEENTDVDVQGADSGNDDVKCDTLKVVAEKRKQIDASRIYTRKKNKGDSKIDEAYEIMKKIYQGKKERDEFDIFGEQVACKLRKLRTNYGQITTQHLINNIMWEAELGKYDNPNPSSVMVQNYMHPIPNPYTSILSSSYSAQPPIHNSSISDSSLQQSSSFYSIPTNYNSKTTSSPKIPSFTITSQSEETSQNYTAL